MMHRMLGFTLIVAACGGSKGSKGAVEPEGGGDLDTGGGGEAKAEEPPPDPDAGRLIPKDATCVPKQLADRKPDLRLALVGGAPVLCAIDTASDDNRGVLACWSVDTKEGALTPREAAAPPGIGIREQDAWVAQGTKGGSVTVGAGAIAVEGGNAIPLDGVEPAAVAFVDTTVYVQGADGIVHAFRTADGKVLGPVTQLGGKKPKPISVTHGGLIVVDDEHVGLADAGLQTLTLVEAKTTGRAKKVRKVPKNPCKPKEMETFGEGAKPKCADHVKEVYAPFDGVSLITHEKDYLAVRGGEVVVLDGKTLVEERVVGNAWCAE
jgi:hypothetical protein